MNEPIVLAEYSTRLSVPISQEDAAILRSARALTASPSATEVGAWDLTAGHHVGVIHAGRTEVRILPKVPVQSLLFLLGYARDPAGWGRSEALFDEVAELVPALAYGFEYQTTRALSQGILNGYVSMDEALPLVRGRLRASDQMTHRHLVPIPVELTFDEYSPDILENRILRTASRTLLGLHGLAAPVRRRLRHLLARLDGVTDLPRGRPFPRVTFGRLNERYRAAVTLGTLVLEGRATGEEVGTRRAVSFLFDMNRVFEDFVGATLAPRIADQGFHVELQLTDSLDEAGKVSIRPDLSWWRQDRCVGVADIKYKSLSTSDLPNADIYQLLAYCVAHNVPKGFLIYAAGNEPPALHRVRNVAVEIEVVALNLELRATHLLTSLDALAARIVGRDIHAVGVRGMRSRTSPARDIA